jgi:hypothetical protein
MINPSANGWIVKFLSENQAHFIDFQGDHLAFYDSCRKTGFIYGYVVNFQLKIPIDASKWSYDEITKVGFLNTLYSIYSVERKLESPDDFLLSVYELSLIHI